jgi:hypothetical protein
MEWSLQSHFPQQLTKMEYFSINLVTVYYKFCKDHSIFSLFNNANINIQSNLVRPINDNKLFTYSFEHGKLQARYIKEFNSLQQYKDNL